jgi:chemotaxis methyl-accepting protein methylase
MINPVLQSLPELSSDDFHYFKEVIFERAGISLSQSKVSLVQSRLRNRLVALGLKEFSEYRVYLEGLTDPDPEWEIFINLLTTNKTDWFREPAHFDFVEKEIVPQWIKRGMKKISIWSAAASTGEEAYSLAILFDQLSQSGHRFDYEILGTDIDTEVLEIAKNGVYSKSRLSLVSPEIRDTYFITGKKELSDWVRLNSEIKARVKFKQLNLLHTHAEESRSFDLIFCRNVFIYFKKDVIKKVTENLYRQASPGAYLMIGHSESLHGIKHPWNFLKPSIFVKEGG